MTKAQLVRYENRREEIKASLSEVDDKIEAMEEILTASHPEDKAEREVELDIAMYLRAARGSVNSAELLMIDCRIETPKRLKDPQ